MRKLLFAACLALSASIHSMEIDQDLLEDTRLMNNLGDTCRYLAGSPNIQENLAIIDFEQLIRNSQYQICTESLDILKAKSLIQQDGTIHPAVKEIIKLHKEEKKSND